MTFDIQSSADKVDIQMVSKEGNYQPAYNEIKVELIGLDRTIFVNGKPSSIIKL